MSALVRPMLTADWPAVEAIYREGINSGHATFETEPPTWSDFDARKRADLRFVALDGDTVTGWAAASPTSTRAVYRGVVEHSVYVAQHTRGRGVGRSLVRALVQGAEQAGVWTVQSSVFPENTASLDLHAVLGFRVVGTRERIAQMTYGPLAGQWRDTLLIERRSSTSRCDASGRPPD